MVSECESCEELYFSGEELAERLGGVRAFGKLVDLFMLESEERVNTLSHLFENRLWAELKTSFHTLKGMCANMAAKRMAIMCANGEKLLSCGSEVAEEEVKILLDQIRHCYAETEKAMREFPNKIGS